ncbi:restriction endonuclease subunit S [Staphylococcus simulans]|nr:restriction endonuclease subunit S [Staphylococcus simulans]UXV42449.1 restriction endonuclease subunit S [Staphylococcus simulans]
MEISKIRKLSSIFKGQIIIKKDLNINGNPCILYGELYTKYGAILNKVYSKTSTQNDSLVFSKRNQILIPSSGETDIDIATATAIDTDVKIAIGGDLNIITPINSDGRFISLYINGKGKYNLAKYAQGKSVVHLYNSDIKKLNFYLPTNMVEQKKIGNFFSKLDRQIELEEEKLELLEQQKRGYMQKIFSQELRFKDENGNEYPEWEDKKLLNVIAIQNGYAFKSNLFSEKGMPIIRITDINKSTVKKGTVYYPESIEINERFKIKQYDILIAMSGATTGKVGKYISEKPSLLNQRIGKFVMKKGTDNNFMFTYLNSLYFKKELSKLLVAGAQPNISSQDIENINLFIPINEEQRKIGEFFNELDELIEKQSSKIDVLKQRKKGFLQKMFV